MSCSHSFESLFRTEKGVLFRCPACGLFNVVFGPVILTYGPEGFQQLCRRVDALEPAADPKHHIGDRCYHLRTKDRQIGLAFTPEEVEELNELLRGGAAMAELETMLDEELGEGPRQ